MERGADLALDAAVGATALVADGFSGETGRAMLDLCGDKPGPLKGEAGKVRELFDLGESTSRDAGARLVSGRLPDALDWPAPLPVHTRFRASSVPAFSCPVLSLSSCVLEIC